MRAFVIGLAAAISGTIMLCEALAAQSNAPRILSLSPWHPKRNRAARHF